MSLTGSRNVVNTPDETAATWFATTFCHDCKAARLLAWQRGDYDTEGPLHAVKLPSEWAALHCDYFRRRIELPGQLTECGAHQRKA